ncbi:MAG: peptide chain release factor-like protein [Treponema sp.]|nr:peptide chain release factor-like protein [Treponema sp.]
MSKSAEKKLLFSLSKDNGDFIVEYYNGTGNGGQNRNKREMACRIRHPKSGALATCQEERHQKANRERAFTRLVKSQKFQNWLKLETAKRAGDLDDIDQKVENAMRQAKIEVKDDDGRWIEASPDYEWQDIATA